MVGIYGIFRKSDDKCVYVGESKDVRNRIKHHLNGHTKNSFNKDDYYGEMIEQHFINDKQYRLEREAYWIEQLQPELNIVRDETKRGEYISGENSPMYGTHRSDKTKKKISEAKKGKPSPMKGKHPSEETKKKMSEAKKGENAPWFGKHLSEDHRKKIGEPFKDRKWINNGVTNKRVKPDELHQYLNNGWKIGRTKLPSRRRSL